MEFADPKSDIAFKKLFADQKHSCILISFLNSILQKKDGEKILQVKISDPNNQPLALEYKLSIVDVRCTDEQGKHYIVEMQVAAQRDFFSQVQYYSALALSRQLKKGWEYRKLKSIISVNVVDFKLNTDSKEYLTHHLTIDSSTGKQSLKLFEFHFIELSKFQKKLSQLKTIEDKWIYLLKNAAKMEAKPKSLSQEEEIEHALQILNMATWSDKEHENYEKFLDAERVVKDVRETAIAKANAQGLEKGREEGREEGHAKAMIKIARNMLKSGMSKKEISKITGLTDTQLKNIKGKS